MTDAWRVIDSGLREPAQHIALDRALLEACNAGEIAPTLRFFRHTPSILLASRQPLVHECQPHVIGSSRPGIQRRLTGGTTWFCAAAHLGFSLYFRRPDARPPDMQAIGRQVCTVVIAALAAVGVDARVRGAREIAVDGRQIGVVGGVSEGAGLLYQGVLHFDFDAGEFVRASRNPGEGLGQRATAAAAARICGINALTGRRVDVALLKDRMIAAIESEFGIECHDNELSLTEHARFEHALAGIASPAWIDLVPAAASDVALEASEGSRSFVAHVLADRVHRRIKSVWFVRGTELTLGSGALELEAMLADTAYERIERNVETCFASRGGAGGCSSAEMIAVLRRALQLPLVVYPGAPRR